ncbi:MAG: hypothetical protein ACLP9L_21985 [Thermoguttaceae bacterium]
MRHDNNVLAKIKANPGLTAKSFPVNQRGSLRSLELQGLIEYRNDGWYPVAQEPKTARNEGTKPC